MLKVLPAGILIAAAAVAVVVAAPAQATAHANAATPAPACLVSNTAIGTAGGLAPDPVATNNCANTVHAKAQIVDPSGTTSYTGCAAIPVGASHDYGQFQFEYFGGFYSC